jgi:hypothetical protein
MKQTDKALQKKEELMCQRAKDYFIEMKTK